MPIPDAAFADTPELKSRIIQPEDSRMRLSVADLDKVDDLARSQGREYPWRLSNEALEASRQETMAGRENKDLWVFGYGSLIWDPGLEAVELRRARTSGYRRRFCLTQTYDRGSMQHPGLMLALDRGDAQDRCDAIVMRIPAEAADTESGYLWRREMIAGSYTPGFIDCETTGGSVEAIAFLVSRDLPRYVDWPLERQAKQIAGASGAAGTNAAYLENLVTDLQAVGIQDRDMEQLLRLVRDQTDD